MNNSPWVEQFSSQYNAPFWGNKVTGETTWVNPHSQRECSKEASWSSCRRSLTSGCSPAAPAPSGHASSYYQAAPPQQPEHQQRPPQHYDQGFKAQHTSPYPPHAPSAGDSRPQVSFCLPPADPAFPHSFARFRRSTTSRRRTSTAMASTRRTARTSTRRRRSDTRKVLDPTRATATRTTRLATPIRIEAVVEPQSSCTTTAILLFSFSAPPVAHFFVLSLVAFLALPLRRTPLSVFPCLDTSVGCAAIRILFRFEGLRIRCSLRTRQRPLETPRQASRVCEERLRL